MSIIAVVSIIDLPTTLLTGALQNCITYMTDSRKLVLYPKRFSTGVNNYQHNTNDLETLMITWNDIYTADEPIRTTQHYRLIEADQSRLTYTTWVLQLTTRRPDLHELSTWFRWWLPLRLNVSHHHGQQSFSGLPSPGRSDYTIKGLTYHTHKYFSI